MTTVSVVVPVHDTVDYLPRCLDSLTGQDVEGLQVIAVDDGSTDGSGEWLDTYAAAHPEVIVIHQPASGGPGGPRNRGIAASLGRYLFFIDSDDALGSPDALRRLCDYADAHDADVVIPRLVAADATSKIFQLTRTTPDGHVIDGLRSQGPQKLFRRALIVDNGITFPEGAVRLEDAVFVLRAGLHSRRIALLADHDYYIKYRRVDGTQYSHQIVDPAGYVDGLMTMAADVIRLRADDPDDRDAILLYLCQRKVLRRLRARPFLQYGPIHRRRWMREIKRFITEIVSSELERRLPLLPRLRSALVRRGDVQGLVDLAKIETHKQTVRVFRRGGREFLDLASGRAIDVTGLLTAHDRMIHVRAYSPDRLRRASRWQFRRVAARVRRSTRRVTKSAAPRRPH